MKKLFIGCGIVVLLFVGVCAYVIYQVAPQLTALQTEWNAAFDRLKALEHDHPFDPQAQSALPLDSQRFAASLDLRVQFADDIGHLRDQLRERTGQGQDGKGPGVIDSFRGLFSTLTPAMSTFATHLEEKQMSWPEYAWHTRLLWACLLRVDAGAGPPGLEPLRGSYTRFQENYAREQQRQRSDKLPPLAEIIGTFPAPLVNEATALLLSDVDRVRLGLSETGADQLYMQPISKPEDFSKVGFPQSFGDEDVPRPGVGDPGALQVPPASDDGRRFGDSPASPGLTEPAGAPVPIGGEPPAGAPKSDTLPAPKSPPPEPDKPGG